MQVPETVVVQARESLARAAGELEGAVTIEQEAVPDFLGPQKYISEVAERTSQSGVATGLAWTPTGGEIMFIEATKMPGKGGLMLRVEGKTLGDHLVQNHAQRPDVRAVIHFLALALLR